MQQAIDINCDLGEGESALDCERDALIMPHISRCNIACGGHAGNPQTMRLSLQNARRFGIAAGAHPGYADKANFGRHSLTLAPAKLEQSLLAQINNLIKLATEESVPLRHIKLHGALYNDAEKDPGIADFLSASFHHHFPHLPLLVLAGGAMQKSAQRLGIKFLREGFMDRAYQSSGQLVPRAIKGAVYDDRKQAISQALKLAKRQSITDIDGQPLALEIDSICLHGDGQHAVTIATELSQSITAAGLEIAKASVI